jgi:sec-independent protein translocase protein TatB
MLGLTFDKLLVIALIAGFLLGPQRLPAAAGALGRVVRNLRKLADETTGRIREEMGPEFDEIDWTRLDPRQYDPRRIIRDALTAEPVQRGTQPGVSEPAVESAAVTGTGGGVDIPPRRTEES